MTDTTFAKAEGAVNLSASDAPSLAPQTDAGSKRAEATYQIPVLKTGLGKSAHFLEVCTDDLPDNVFREAIALGLKALLAKGYTKITKETYPKPEELKAAAIAKAQENLAAMKAGTISIRASKAAKVSGKVMTEARRIAKNMIKEMLKADGVKISHVDAKDITAAANALIQARPDLVKQAEESIKEQEDKLVTAKSAMGNLSALVPVNAKKVAKIDAEKAKAKESLSKTQAGKPQPRQKPTSRANA